MDALYTDRVKRASSGENVFSNVLIDLYVKRGSSITEVYEVKPSAGRQALYTAIGQLETNAAGSGAKKTLVVPEEDALPADIDNAINRLNIAILRSRLRKSRNHVHVQFL